MNAYFRASFQPSLPIMSNIEDKNSEYTIELYLTISLSIHDRLPILIRLIYSIEIILMRVCYEKVKQV